jgi:hypothetical protein
VGKHRTEQREELRSRLHRAAIQMTALGAMGDDLGLEGLTEDLYAISSTLAHWAYEIERGRPPRALAGQLEIPTS